MKQRYYYDFETQGLPEADLLRVIPEFEAPGNIKDPTKIAAAIAEKKADWIDKAALKAISGKIVATTAAWDDEEPIMQTGEEKDLIVAMLASLKDCISLGVPAYGWNSSGFDLPFLCQRAAVHGIPAFKHLMVNVRGRFYWHESLVDAKLIWSNYSPDHTGTSLKTVSAALGTGIKDGSGKDFAELLLTDRAKAESYAKNDVALLREAVKRMGI